MDNLINEYTNLQENFKKIGDHIKLLDYLRLKNPLIQKELKKLKKLEELRNKIEFGLDNNLLYITAVMSIYSIFETFIYSLICSYCEFLLQNFNSFSEIPDKLVSFYFKNLGEKLKKTSKRLEFKILIQEGYNLLNNKELKLNNDLLRDSQGNFKIEKVTELLAKIGIENAKNKISSNSTFKEFKKNYDETDNNNIYKLLDTFIEERNKVAHFWDWNGNNQREISLNDLQKKIIPLIECICECLLEIILLECFKYISEKGRFANIEFKKVKDNDKILLVENLSITLHKDTYIFFKIENDKSKEQGKEQKETYYIAKIISIYNEKDEEIDKIVENEKGKIEFKIEFTEDNITNNKTINKFYIYNPYSKKEKKVD